MRQLAQPADDDGRREDAERQAAQHHIEGAGDLLGKIVSVDGVSRPARRCLESRSQDDADDDARNGECA